MPTLTTLVSFNNTDGGDPEAGLIADAAGDLFGTTANGGANGDGSVFEIVKTGGSYASTPVTLVSFNETDGAQPVTGLIADAAGDLFGTTQGGGPAGAPFAQGIVFEIAKTAGGYASTPTTLVSFNATQAPSGALVYPNGAGPKGRLIADASGDLFGTTWISGTGTGGTVFEIAKTAGGYASTATTLINPANPNASGGPEAGLVADAAGDLFGTTTGSLNGGGTVFEVAKTAGGYASTATTLFTFNSVNGSFPNGDFPQGGLIIDAAGDLFGTTETGGANGDGTVFEIAKTAGGYAAAPIILASFNGTDGLDPQAGLIMDAAGDLFGTTLSGGGNTISNVGTVFEIIKTNGVYASTPTVLIRFTGLNGANPVAGLIADAAGNLFGTTEGGGTNGDGTVFELSGTGFRVTALPTPDNFTGNGTSDILYRNDATGDTGFYGIVNSANSGWNDVGASSTAYGIVGVGDFNGDGTSDILYRNAITGDTGFYSIVNGANTGWHDVGASSTAYSVAGVGDFNGDHTSDILYRNTTTGDTGFYAIVNGANTGWYDVGASSTAYSVVGVGDFNGDGTSDICTATTPPATPGSMPSSTVPTPAGTMSARPRPPTAWSGSAISTATAPRIFCTATTLPATPGSMPSSTAPTPDGTTLARPPRPTQS
jgi:uncharacterized repeat protein (TIGR03803 family)